MKKRTSKILTIITVLLIIGSFGFYKVMGPDSTAKALEGQTSSTELTEENKDQETESTESQKEEKSTKKESSSKKEKTTEKETSTKKSQKPKDKNIDVKETVKNKEESKTEKKTEAKTNSEVTEKEDEVSAVQEKTETKKSSEKEKDIYNTKYVAFSFDDGPNAKTTNRILDALEKQNFTASFFVVGYQVYGKNIDTMKRAAKMGCDIGNHTMNHNMKFKEMSLAEVNSEISECKSKIKSATGINPVLFRPPGGYTDSTKGKIKYPIILWNIDTNDWQKKDKASNPAEIKKLGDYIISEIENNPGSIVLMHDIYQFSAETVEYVMPRLAKKGYKVVSVSELARLNNIKLENGKIYFSLEKEVILEPGKYIVNTKKDPLTLRKNASPDSTALTTIPKGTVISITDNKNNFVKVKYNGYTGWVKGRYLKKAS